MSDSKCPRCKSDVTELGTPVVKVGKTRQMRVSFKQCPTCSLIFYEALSK